MQHFRYASTLNINYQLNQFNNWSCFAVIAFTECLSYKLYIVYEKESVATKFSPERLFRKISCKAGSLFIKNFFFQVVDLRVYYDSTTVFWMIWWNFSEQPSLTTLVCSPLAKMITRLRKQSNTQQVNAWDNKKITRLF